MKPRKRNALWCNTGVLALSATFLCFAFRRQDPWADAGATNIMAAVLAALWTLLFLVYTLLPRSTHGWVTRTLLGLAAGTATTCSIMLGAALWSNHVTLIEDRLFPFLALVFAFALGASFIAWKVFFKQFKSPK